MVDAAAFAAILVAITLGAISPGPSFVYVARGALSRGRRAASISAVGMGIGGVAFALLALFGLSAILHYAEWAYLGLKVLGGAYLVVLGIRMWRGAGHVSPEATPVPDQPGWRTLVGATIVQVSNPKAGRRVRQHLRRAASGRPVARDADGAAARDLRHRDRVVPGRRRDVLSVGASPRLRALRSCPGSGRGGAAGGLGAAFALDGARAALR